MGSASDAVELAMGAHIRVTTAPLSLEIFFIFFYSFTYLYCVCMGAVPVCTSV